MQFLILGETKLISTGSYFPEKNPNHSKLNDNKS